MKDADEIERLRALWAPIEANVAKELKFYTMPALLDCPDDIGQARSGAHRLAHLIVQWDTEKKRADTLDAEIERLRALVGEMRDALRGCAEELACLSDRRGANVAYHHARAAIAKADEVLNKEPVT